MRVPVFGKASNKVKINKWYNSKELSIFVVGFASIGVLMLITLFASTGLTIDGSLPVPQNVSAWGDDKNIIVGWDAVENDNRVVGYYVTYRPVGSSEEFKVKQTIHNRVQLQPLINGTEYEIYVQSASGNIQRTGLGDLVYSGGQNHYRRGDGKVSNKADVTAAPTNARVEVMRQRLTGFFDDFNLPAGPFDELKWNQAPNACVEPSVASAFINDQFHTHNIVRTTFCDRAGMATRPRATFDMSQVTEQNPGIIEVDVDGATHGRDSWYLDIIPLSARTNGYPIDITSHNDLFDADNEDPGNMVRLNARRNETNLSYYDINRNPRELNSINGEPNCDTLCDFSVKNPDISPVPQSDFPRAWYDSHQIPNVRNHWAVHITPSNIKVYVNGTQIRTVETPSAWFNEQKFTVHSTIFSYNTGKDSSHEGSDQITPYVQLLHWDNFGFNGPSDNTVIHNYQEGQETGDKPVLSIGAGDNAIEYSGTRTTIIPVPDDIGNLIDDQGALYFTMQMFGYQGYWWDPNSHLLFNGVRYDVPNPESLVNAPYPQSCSRGYTTYHKPFSLAIPINKADIKTGNNVVKFNIKSRPNNCNRSDPGLLNVHLELPYDASDPNIPDYTQPIDIFGDKFLGIIRPPITNCDAYRYVEQDLGLPYHSGKANLQVGPCVLMAGHSASDPSPDPPPLPENDPPTVTLNSSTASATAPAAFSITSVASDRDGEIVTTEISLDGNQVLSCNSTDNCTYNASNVAAGTYTYVATVTDNNGAIVESNSVIVIVSEPTPEPESNFFETLPVNAALPSESECVARVKPRLEVRPLNTPHNNTRGIGGSYRFPGVTGDYTGTTDEIIQWAACKWGMDEDILRAQMVLESYWHQSAIGDFNAGGNELCSPVYPIGGNYPAQYSGQCPESYGLSQVRWTYHKSAFYSAPEETEANLTNNAIYSTAYNVDYWGALWRECYNGDFDWLNTVERGRDYTAGDVWGCLGMWFSGRWYTDAANWYIDSVQDILGDRVWEQSFFLNSQPSNTIPDRDTPAQDTTPPSVAITSPTNGATVSGTVPISVNASDDVAVTRISYYLDSSPTPFSNDSTEPYNSSWNSASVSNGSHTIKAVATDSSGNTSESAITVNVQNVVPDTTAPTTQILEPADEATVEGIITVSAGASDDVGISKVELLIGGQLAFTDTSSPYSYQLDTNVLSDGEHELRTRAYDSSGNNTFSNVVTITVDNVIPAPEVCEDSSANNTGQPLPCTYDEPSDPPEEPEPGPEPTVDGDATGDDEVNVRDIVRVLINWNKTGASKLEGDVNGDGVVNIRDIVRILTRWSN